MTTEISSTHLRGIVDALGKSVGYGQALLADVDPDDFAHMPSARFNHPAFNYGHLALYPNRCLEMVGRADAVVELPFETEHYEQTAECLEQDGRYASMEVLTGAFDASHARLLEVLPEIDPECFSADLPEGRYRDFFGTVGNAVTFITCSHPMMHLGQVSMWRRAMGLGSCM